MLFSLQTWLWQLPADASKDGWGWRHKSAGCQQHVCQAHTWLSCHSLLAVVRIFCSHFAAWLRARHSSSRSFKHMGNVRSLPDILSLWRFALASI